MSKRIWLTLLALSTALLIAGATVGRLSGFPPEAGVGPGMPARAPTSNAPRGSSDLAPIASRDLVYPEVRVAAHLHAANLSQLLGFVSREIGNDPYEGALRGARGTLLAGAGSAADKALLLRDLVRISDPAAQIRFAIGTLPPAEAEGLASAALAEPRLIGAPEPTVSPPGRAQIDGRVALDARRREIVDRLTALWAAEIEHVKIESAALAATLRGAGLNLGSVLVGRQELVRAATNHVWLQILRGDRWIDLDPTSLDSIPGRSRTTPMQTVGELPDHLYHRLSIAVRIEERTAGRHFSRFLLQSDWRTADLSGSTITLGFAEPLGLNRVGAAPPASPDSIRYTPILLVDDERRTGSSVTLPRLPGSGTEALGGKIGDLLRGGGIGRGALRGMSTGEAGGAPELTGLWLELVSRTPDGRVERTERPIVDRIGYATRQEGNAESTPLAPLAISNGHYIDLLTLSSVAVWTGERAVPASLLQAAAEGAQRLTGLFDSLEDVGIFHRAFYGLRRALFESVTLHDRSGLLVSRPNVSLLSSVRYAGAPDGVLVLDILDSGVGHLGRGDGRLPPGLVWGQANLQAERLTFDSINKVLPVDGRFMSRRPPAIDVAAVFARARDEGIPLLVMVPATAERAEAVSASSAAKARLRARLTEGWIVVVPERAVSVGPEPVIGWWLVNPATGVVLDEMESGRHQTTVESPAVNSQGKKETAAAQEGFMTRLGRTARCLGVATQIVLGTAEIYVGATTGDVNSIESGVQNVFDGLEGLNPSCSDGDAGMPSPPPAAGGARPPDPPSLPRFKK